MDVIPLEQLYAWCRVARRILNGEHAVGRVIARPFDGPTREVRAPSRAPGLRPAAAGPDGARPPAGAGVPVLRVGKIRDIFDGHGITEARYSDSNDHGVDLTIEYLARPAPAFVFTNLVDFDLKYGHRNDAPGYAAAMEAFDGGSRTCSRRSTAACCSSPATTAATRRRRRPTIPRERTPLLAAGLPGGPHRIGTRETFADLGDRRRAARRRGADLARLELRGRPRMRRLTVAERSG